MIWKASLVLCLAISVHSYKRPAVSEQKITRYHHGDLKHYGNHEPEHHEIYAWAYPSYEFSYHVDDPHTHDIKGQHEIRDGDKVTGNYWLLQPDGRKRTVKYSSDHKKGFQAEVNYVPRDGHHPEHHGKHHIHKDDDHKKMDLWDEDKKRHDRRDDDKDEKRAHERQSWGWISPRINHREEQHIEEKKQSHTEHWKHGVLVGWREGKDRNGRDEDRDDRRRDRDDDRRKDWNDDRRKNWNDDRRKDWNEDRRRDRDDDSRKEDQRRDNEDRRGSHSNYRPIMKFKPIVPYGDRLH